MKEKIINAVVLIICAGMLAGGLVAGAIHGWVLWTVFKAAQRINGMP